MPALWHLELGNVLVQAERRGRLPASHADRHLILLAALPIDTDEPVMGRTLANVMGLARAEGLTAYDAAYLELAVRQGLPLATLDRPLADAAHRRGIRALPASVHSANR